MIQYIQQYKIGESTVVNAIINGRRIHIPLEELQQKAIEFKQAMAKEDAMRLLRGINP